MSSRAKRVRKGKGKEAEEDDCGGVDKMLLPRLFGTDRYPSKRHNCNASLEYLLLIRDVLEGTDELEMLLGSCFGALFRLPVRRCAFSGKLVHGMITRQVVTKKRFEMWSAFGGQPLRFSLAEFGEVTGLPCGEFEPGYYVEDKTKPKKADYVYWDRLFGGRRDLTIKDVAAMVAQRTDLPPSRKLKLCLVILVDGVLLATKVEPKPTLKHVQRLQSLRKFMQFQWGRESFWWTIKSMLIPDRVMGVCEDPEGVLRMKLRQETLALAGFPLALQLWAFEAIPGLLKRLGGNDRQLLFEYEGEKLPQHKGLTLTQVFDTENEAELKVQPMVDRKEDWEEGWGEFDSEIKDTRVSYIVRLLESGHKFHKADWGGGDCAEPLYVHVFAEKAEKEVKRRKTRAAKDDTAEGPVLKQRRLSRYFNRQVPAGGVKVEDVDAKVEKLTKMVLSLKKLLVEQIMMRGRKGVKMGRFSSSRLLGARKRKKKEIGAGKKILFDESDGDGSDHSSDGEETLGEDGIWADPDSNKDKDPEMAETNVVPLEVARQGVPEEEGHEVYFGSGSNTFFVAEEEGFNEEGVGAGFVVENANPLSYVEGWAGDKGACGTVVDFGALDTLVGAITGLNSAAESKEAELKDGVQARVNKVGGTEDGGDGDGPREKVITPLEDPIQEAKGGDLEREDANVNEVITPPEEPLQEGTCEDLERVVANESKAGIGDGNEDSQLEQVPEDNVAEDVVELSDSSPMKRAEKHRPAEKEAELAALLLAKEPFDMKRVVPTDEDGDYPFFESVLLANPKVVHYNAGKFDLENEFFVQLATGEEWVSTKHMEVLIDFLGSRHAEILKERRCLFLPPWFSSHLVGKTRAYKAAKENPGRVLGDGRLSGYLTKEGKRWGVDVDTLYTPMIWCDNHWVGLCISLVKWCVLVLDPNPKLREMDAVQELMGCICKMLPHLVAKVCPVTACGPYSLLPFKLEMMDGVYQNVRSGDCGPVSMKFIELHALGNPEPRMEGLTDGLVDIMRKQYAMDVYREWVLPLYMGK